MVRMVLVDERADECVDWHAWGTINLSDESGLMGGETLKRTDDPLAHLPV